MLFDTSMEYFFFKSLILIPQPYDIVAVRIKRSVNFIAAKNHVCPIEDVNQRIIFQAEYIITSKQCDIFCGFAPQMYIVIKYRFNMYFFRDFFMCMRNMFMFQIPPPA